MDAWWTRPWVLAALVVASAIPLLWPAIPPLIDLPGHIGRYRVAIGIGESADLARYYSYDWRLIGNLGVDLLVIPLARLVGLEFAVKLIVLAIPPLTVAGMLWTAREAHGRVPPTAMFALPLAYAYPFQFGFVNFALAMALALLGFALWLRLARTGRIRLRLILFTLLVWPLWIAHTFGWGFFGLLAFGAEFVRRRALGDGVIGAGINAALYCLPLALPAVAMLIGGADALPAGASGDWFNLRVKVQWLVSILRDRWKWFDVASAAVIILLLFAALRDKRLRIVGAVGVPALLCLIAFILLPRILLGSAYADMRMIPYAAALGVLAISPRGAGSRFALAALAFFCVRIAATTISFASYSAAFTAELAAVDAIPQGASVLALVAKPCPDQWSHPRFDHLPSIAIARRDAFANDQWTAEGAQLVHVRHRIAAPYTHDPSQFITPARCRGEGPDFDAAIAGFNRAAFDHVWTIGFPPGRARASDLVPVWTNGRSTLYRVAGSREEKR